MNHLVPGNLNALKQLLDNVITEGCTAWSIWRTPAERVASANDPIFAHFHVRRTCTFSRSRVKKGAKLVRSRAFQGDRCQNIAVSEFQGAPRRYWGASKSSFSCSVSKRSLPHSNRRQAHRRCGTVFESGAGPIQQLAVKAPFKKSLPRPVRRRLQGRHASPPPPRRRCWPSGTTPLVRHGCHRHGSFPGSSTKSGTSLS